MYLRYSQIVDFSGKELAEQCIELFVRNVAIIRPISMVGRTKLKSDCVHLETALKPLISDITSFGRPYRYFELVFFFGIV